MDRHPPAFTTSCTTGITVNLLHQISTRFTVKEAYGWVFPNTSEHGEPQKSSKLCHGFSRGKAVDFSGWSSINSMKSSSIYQKPYLMEFPRGNAKFAHSTSIFAAVERERPPARSGTFGVAYASTAARSGSCVRRPCGVPGKWPWFKGGVSALYCWECQQKSTTQGVTSLDDLL